MLDEKKMTDSVYDVSFAIVGGGIAGVSCAEQLANELPDASIVLISPSHLIKVATNIKKHAAIVEEFDIEEKPYSELETQFPNISIINASAVSLDSINHILHLSNDQKVVYKKLCLCTGAVPKVIASDCPYILGIRDTETIEVFQKKLASASRIVVVGNGGIAIELVYGIEGCQIIWAIKDSSIGKTFFDAGAAEFFLPHLKDETKRVGDPVCKRIKYTTKKEPSASLKESVSGSALGPDWSSGVKLKGKDKFHHVRVEYECEVEKVYSLEEYRQTCDKESILNEPFTESGDWSVYVKLSNNTIYGCDFVVSATGVVPNCGTLLQNNQFDMATDGGLKVNDQMQTSLPDVYAAGDICSSSWDPAKHWFQMRLWTQARQMGAYAGRCMAANMQNETATMDICFDLFTHVTHFFGYKVVLLGLFNCQKLGEDCELLLRMTKGMEYIKVVLQDGRMQGAVLIGETDLEETFENLILNQLDLTRYGEDLLNPNIDIEDYFD